MHPGYTVVAIEVSPDNDMEEFNKLMDEWQDEMRADIKRIEAEFGVSDSTAAAIHYLRGRSRWTDEKEAELIERDKSGNPIPLADVLSGEF